jgi:hypothetical protein
VPLWAKSQQTAPESLQSGNQHFSTKSYMNFCRLLSKFGIERQPYETACELKTRAAVKIRQSQPSAPDLPGLIDNFVDNYSQARFGLISGESELLALGAKIQERLENKPSEDKIA